MAVLTVPPESEVPFAPHQEPQFSIHRPARTAGAQEQAAWCARPLLPAGTVGRPSTRPADPGHGRQTQLQDATQRVRGVVAEGEGETG